MPEFQRIVFPLEPDDDGYPPVGRERVWAEPLGDGRFRIGNIPFYVYGVGSGDVVLVKVEGDELIFQSVEESAGASVFRIIFINADTVCLDVVRDLRKLGCRVEINAQMLLVAVEVPAAVSPGAFLSYVIEGAERGIFEYEEGVLRHDIPDKYK